VLSSKKGLFGHGPERFDDKVTCVKNFGGKYLAGNIGGDLIVWVGNSIAKKSKRNLFTKPIDAITCNNEYAFIGDRNGNICVLNENLQKIHGFNITSDKEIL
jgi:hypothetical protein